MERLKSSYRKFYGRSCLAVWNLPLTNAKWHSDPWPVKVTSQPIRLSTNFMILIPSLTFTDLRVVFIEHLQRVWHASRERLPLRTPGSVPFSGACMCSDHFSRPYTILMTVQNFTLTKLRSFRGAFSTGVVRQQGALTLPDTWFQPPFGDLLLLQLARPVLPNLPYLFLTFHLEYPSVL